MGQFPELILSWAQWGVEVKKEETKDRVAALTASLQKTTKAKN
jgi:hypothetical protein